MFVDCKFRVIVRHVPDVSWYWYWIDELPVMIFIAVRPVESFQSVSVELM